MQQTLSIKENKMPGLDRTGPRGEGPRTGGGWGLCNQPNRQDQTNDVGFGVGRGGRPRGGGRGRCFGGGRGARRSFGRWQNVPVVDDDADLRAEIRTLTDELAQLRAELDAAKRGAPPAGGAA